MCPPLGYLPKRSSVLMHCVHAVNKCRGSLKDAMAVATAC